MSRNIGQRHCRECRYTSTVELTGAPHPVEPHEVGIYFFDEYEGMIVAEAECIVCGTEYLAWVDETNMKKNHGWGRTKGNIHDGTFFDLSYRQSFDDESRYADDLPKWRADRDTTHTVYYSTETTIELSRVFRCHNGRPLDDRHERSCDECALDRRKEDAVRRGLFGVFWCKIKPEPKATKSVYDRWSAEATANLFAQLKPFLPLVNRIAGSPEVAATDASHGIKAMLEKSLRRTDGNVEQYLHIGGFEEAEGDARAIAEDEIRQRTDPARILQYGFDETVSIRVLRWTEAIFLDTVTLCVRHADCRANNGVARRCLVERFPLTPPADTPRTRTVTVRS